jgi:hypothetical protein
MAKVLRVTGAVGRVTGSDRASAAPDAPSLVDAMRAAMRAAPDDGLDKTKAFLARIARPTDGVLRAAVTAPIGESVATANAWAALAEGSR